MATVNPDVLLRLLTEYRDSLVRHLTQLNSEWDSLERQWHSFGPEYQGVGAEQFKAGWARTASNFRDYLDRTSQILRFLDDSIVRLEQVVRPENLP